MSTKFFRTLGVQKAWEYRAEPESLRLLAAVFWRTMLIVALLVFVFALWSGFQELDMASQTESITPSPAATQPWTPAELKAVLNILSQKQNLFQALSQSPLPAVADPSN